MDRTRLILTLPTEAPPTGDALQALLSAADVACVVQLTGSMDEGALIRLIDRSRPVVQHNDVPFLLDAHAAIAAKTGCDGVILPAEEGDPMGPTGEAGLTPLNLPKTREILGEDAILGTLCGASRHAAMVTGEQGADFVALAADEDLLQWWADLFEVPSVALGGPGLRPEDAKRLSEAGADFLMLDPESVFGGERNATDLLKAFDQATQPG